MKPSRARPLVAVMFLAAACGAAATSEETQVDDLVNAAGRGDLTAVKALLAASVDVNAKRRFVGDTALEDACQNGHLEVVQALLAAGANPNAKPDGYSPLI